MVVKFAMTMVLVAVAGAELLGQPVPRSQQTPVGVTRPRPYHAIHQQLRAALRREATEKDATRWAATVVELTDLYRELQQDPRLATSDTLEGYRVKLRHRLRRIQQQLQRTAGNKGRSRTADGAEIAMIAQTFSQANGNGPMPSMMAGLAASMADGHFGGAARSDYGPALVDLIQQTIAPETWNVNGGPGSIVYYRLWYALVVRASGEVHGELRHLTGALRKGR